MSIQLIRSPFAPAFDDFIRSVHDRCLVCSPFITPEPAERLVGHLRSKGLQEHTRVVVLTDLSPRHILDGATEPSALLLLTEAVSHVEIRHIPRVHAKVYVAGEAYALVTSANFTSAGGHANLEYGVAFTDPATVRAISDDVTGYARLGGALDRSMLAALCEKAKLLRASVRDEQRSIGAKARELRSTLVVATEEDLLRARVCGRSIHGIFSETICYLLGKQAMTTEQLHEAVRGIHPDLCNDDVDRIIDGIRFGKLWKHQLRTAQQHLRRRGTIVRDPVTRRWMLVAPQP